MPAIGCQLSPRHLEEVVAVEVAKELADEALPLPLLLEEEEEVVSEAAVKSKGAAAAVALSQQKGARRS